jgi:hypothetical protein
MLGLTKTPPPRQACPGTALATSNMASSRGMATHVCRLPLVKCLVFIAITFLLSPSLEPVRHVPLHGDRHVGAVDRFHHQQLSLSQGIESQIASRCSENLFHITIARIGCIGELTYPSPASISYPIDLPIHL